MSIVIFGDLFSFPDGKAATNRVYTYAKGFIENGVDVHVICFNNDYIDEPNGTVDGMYYYNPFGQKVRSRNFFVRRYQKLKKYSNTYSVFKKINKESKIIAINRWSDTLLTQVFAWILSRIFRTIIITECNEHPLRYVKNDFFSRKKGNIIFYLDSWLSDGILCISRYLIDFHIKRSIKPEKLFLVPSTVDPGRFNNKSQKPIEGFYIGYFGSLTFRRDNIDLLINAFSVFSKHHPDVCLALGGFCTEQELLKIRKLIEELQINDKVKIIQYLTRNQIVQYISNADVLVMVRAKDMESDASYPSKLAEFLATGKPVISVNVGEVSDYLKDGENSFLIEPGNVVELVNKLEYIFSNYEQAKEVGRKGKLLTAEAFNYSHQAKRIIGFIQSLKK